MKQFTVEYCRKGCYGYSICTVDTIEELLERLSNNGYEFYYGEKQKIIDWSKTTKKKYYGTGLTIRRGELEMTEYTSF